MAKDGKKEKATPKVTLYERIDTDVLRRLISAKGLDGNEKKRLKIIQKKMDVDGNYEVNYLHSKDLTELGRLYAEHSLSLQNIPKKIRHALARDIYIDIDMENAHPRIVLQYCKKHKIACEKLEYYVNNRDEVLKKIMKGHDLTRDQAKTLMLRLMYLGAYKIPDSDDLDTEPEKLVKIAYEFKTELAIIAKEVCKIETSIYELVQEMDQKKNKKAAVLSITAQEIEQKCLMAMRDYFEYAGLVVGVLCFDGLMIEKSDKTKDIPEILKKCEKYVKKSTGYEILLATKPMDSKLSFDIPEFSKYVTSDRDCQEKLFLLEGANKFKYCKGDLYIFDERTGLFSTDPETLDYYLIKNKKYLNIVRSVGKDGTEKIDNYGDSSMLYCRVVAPVKSAARNDKWLDETQGSSLGKLLFNNGIYDMKTGEFNEGFDENIVFHVRIPWDFPKRDETEIKYAMSKSFDVLFENPKPMIAAIACALAGDNEHKRIYFCPGRSNAGKSIFIKMLKKTFGTLVSKFDMRSLSVAPDNDTRDPAASQRWALLSRFARVLFSSEVSMKKKLDGNLIKMHASGCDDIIGRTHGGEEVAFEPHYTLFSMANDIPEIEQMDEAVMNRLTYMEFPYVFVKDKTEDFHKTRDMEIGKKILEKRFINGFIHIFLDAYKDILENGMPEFDEEVKKKWTEEGQQESSIIEMIKSTYEITGNDKDRISKNEMNIFKKQHKDKFQHISAHRFKEILTRDLKLTEGNSEYRYWGCIRKRTNQVDIDFD